MAQGDWSKLASEPYRVPERFNFGAALSMITIFAIVFGALRHYDAHPVWYVYLSLQALLISGLQMAVGKSPRAISAMAGAIFLPTCFIVFAVSGAVRFRPSLIDILASLPQFIK